MSDDTEPVIVEPRPVMPLSHQRILVIMAVLGSLGSIAGFAFVSAKFGIGVLIGSVLAFVNYYWLKRSLRGIFDKAAYGEKPKFLGSGYFLRYLVLGVLIAVIFATDVLPIVAVILGMAGFGFAVVVEGLVRIFSSIFSEKEI